jgi:hypothetical protein
VNCAGPMTGVFDFVDGPMAGFSLVSHITSTRYVSSCFLLPFINLVSFLAFPANRLVAREHVHELANCVQVPSGHKQAALMALTASRDPYKRLVLSLEIAASATSRACYTRWCRIDEGSTPR